MVDVDLFRRVVWLKPPVEVEIEFEFIDEGSIRFFLDNGQIDFSPATLHQQIRRFPPVGG